jgi:hypothetical protein
MGRWKNDESHYNDRLMRVHDKICDNPGIDGTALCKTFRSLGRQLLDCIVRELITGGYVRPETIKTNGRPRHRYWPIDKRQPVRAKDRLDGVPVPPEDERKGLLSLIEASSPTHIDWAAIKRIVSEAYA